jgi:DNA-binding winged helix-turn-helix (wHTH) protein
VLMFAAMRYRVGEHVLDLRKFELRKNECLLPAEPQVLSLLFLLIENRDRLVSKDELVATIWGGRAVSDSAISSRIKSARKLLGDDGEAQKLIRTVHGKGFRFVGEVSAEGDVTSVLPLELNGSKPSIAVLPFD